MTPTRTLDYQGSSIRLRGAMLNLTDMWNAAGRPENRRPADWLALEETRRFRALADRHLAKNPEPVLPNANCAGIGHLEPDGFVATARGNAGGTWAHWHLALAYGRYLSAPFHLWCNTVVRAAMERPRRGFVRKGTPVRAHLTELFGHLHRRIDTLDRHAADLMTLQLAARELLLGHRRPFSERSRGMILRAVAAEPHEGLCPCCGQNPVLDAAGQPRAGAEFDHFFHRGLNKPEYGWLVCRDCHAELTHAGYLARFARMPEFRAFQGAVLAQRPPARIRSRPALS